MFATPKSHILARNCVFWHILHQNQSRGLGCSELKEPKKTGKTEKNQLSKNLWYAKSHMHGTETPKQIVMNLCTGVGIHDVITSTNFYDHHLQGLGVVGGQICIVALTTLSTVRVCDNNNEYI